MSGYGRDYIQDGPMYRTAVELANGKVTYRGPYKTPSAAKGQRSKARPSWVEVCYPAWERLEE